MDEDEAYLYDDEGQEQQSGRNAELDELQKKKIRKMYDDFDLDGSGTLSFKELRKGLQLLGLNPSVKDVKEILDEYKGKRSSKGESRKIVYEEFEEIMKEKVLSQTNSEYELFTAFCVFDKDGDGFIDKKELAFYLTKMGEQMSPAEVDDLFSTLDEDGNGRLSVMELSKILAK